MMPNSDNNDYPSDHFAFVTDFEIVWTALDDIFLD
jgi:hypothetical protein